MNPYVVYVKADDKNRIVAINSSAFLEDVAGWTKIDEGVGDRYHHAQGNYFVTPLVDARGVWRYKLEDGRAASRTQAEMDADYEEPIPQPSEAERISQLEEELRAAKILLGLEV